MFCSPGVQKIHEKMAGTQHQGHRDACAAVEDETEKMSWSHQKVEEKVNLKTGDGSRGEPEEGNYSKWSILSISLEIFKDCKHTT